jgi:hypothetical protein
MSSLPTLWSDPSYTDADVVPGERIRYEVVGVAGDVSSRPGSVRLRLGQPSLGQARFDGAFNVDMVATSRSSAIVEPKPYRAQFIFKALCPESEWSCDVSWDEYYGTAEGTLTRRGSSYSGKALGTHLSDCMTGKKIDARLAIDVTVLGATADHGWRVDDFQGTIVESLPAHASCPAVEITWRFTQ